MTTTEASAELQNLVASYHPTWIASSLREPIRVLVAGGMSAPQIVNLVNGLNFADAAGVDLLTRIASEEAAAIAPAPTTPMYPLEPTPPETPAISSSSPNTPQTPVLSDEDSPTPTTSTPVTTQAPSPTPTTFQGLTSLPVLGPIVVQIGNAAVGLPVVGGFINSIASAAGAHPGTVVVVGGLVVYFVVLPMVTGGKR